MYKKELPRVSPESEGISSARLLEMIRRMEACPHTEMHGIMIARHGRVVAEGWWAPYTKDTVHICHSFGKSYVATAIGLACTDGLISEEDRLVDLFAGELAEMKIPLTDNLKKLRVKHVLSMTNGMSVHAMTGAQTVSNYFHCDVDIEPGTVFKYNTAGSCMLGAIVQKVTGRTVREYLTPRIFEKIGLETDKLGWMSFAGGLNAAPGVAATTENNLRLGMLWLNQGKWDGEQLIDPDWMRRATSCQIHNDNSGEGCIDGRSGYGYQLWMDRVPGVYRFDGGHGQVSIMSPKDDLVISIHQAGSMPSGTTEIADILHEYFLTENLPDDPLPEAPEALGALRDYLGSLALPNPESRPLPDGYESWNGIYHVTEGHFHLNTELRPFDTVDVYEDFHTRKDVNIRMLSLYFRSKQVLELVADDRLFEVRLDGRHAPIYTPSDLPNYNQTCSSGYFDESGALVIHTRYYQTCFRTRLRIERTDEGIAIESRKTTLHDGHPYFTEYVKAKRV